MRKRTTVNPKDNDQPPEVAELTAVEAGIAADAGTGTDLEAETEANDSDADADAYDDSEVNADDNSDSDSSDDDLETIAKPETVISDDFNTYALSEEYNDYQDPKILALKLTELEDRFTALEKLVENILTKGKKNKKVKCKCKNKKVDIAKCKCKRKKLKKS